MLGYLGLIAGHTGTQGEDEKSTGRNPTVVAFSTEPILDVHHSALEIIRRSFPRMKHPPKSIWERQTSESTRNKWTYSTIRHHIGFVANFEAMCIECRLVINANEYKVCKRFTKASHSRMVDPWRCFKLDHKLFEVEIVPTSLVHVEHQSFEHSTATVAAWRHDRVFLSSRSFRNIDVSRFNIPYG